MDCFADQINVQVYHYTDARKSCGMAVGDDAAVPEVSGEEQNCDEPVFTEEDLNEATGGAGKTHVAADETHPRHLAQRNGEYFKGTVKWFDKRAQAVYIVFHDGDAGWFQLWRCSELVRVA
jgi:hypothetical protein